VEEVATADVDDEPAAGLHVGVAVDVDEPGDDELADGVDPAVDPPDKGFSDERHPVVVEDEGAAAHQPVAAVGIGDDVAALDQSLHGLLPSPRSRG